MFTTFDFGRVRAPDEVVESERMKHDCHFIGCTAQCHQKRLRKGSKYLRLWRHGWVIRAADLAAIFAELKPHIFDQANRSRKLGKGHVGTLWEVAASDEVKVLYIPRE